MDAVPDTPPRTSAQLRVVMSPRRAAGDGRAQLSLSGMTGEEAGGKDKKRGYEEEEEEEKKEKEQILVVQKVFLGQDNDTELGVGAERFQVRRQEQQEQEQQQDVRAEQFQVRRQEQQEQQEQQQQQQQNVRAELLRAQLKAWEKRFTADSNGRPPGREDIKLRPDIGT